MSREKDQEGFTPIELRVDVDVALSLNRKNRLLWAVLLGRFLCCI
jgi:hypothetical protein